MKPSLRSFGTLLQLAIVLVAVPAAARPFRVNDIPNGQKNTCLNCHGNLTGSTRTPFGSDAQVYLEGSGAVQDAHVMWAPLCPLDSDGDGWSNGRELGDPDCTWQPGDPNPAVIVYNPGNPDSHPLPVCGSGKLEGGEECDGDLMSETDCAQEGAGDGLLGCTADCHFDYTNCSMPPDASTSSGGFAPPPDEEGGCNVSNAGKSEDSAAWLAVLFGIAAAASRRARRSKP